MPHSAGEGGDLASTLSRDQRKELFLLIVKITRYMREQIKKEQNTATTTTTETTTSAALESEKNLPSPHLRAIQDTAVESFDVWRDAVLGRINEVLNNSNTAAKTTHVDTVPHSTQTEHHAAAIQTSLTVTLNQGQSEVIVQSLLLLLLSLQHYEACSRVLLLHVCTSLNTTHHTLVKLETQTAASLLASTSHLNADSESAARAAASQSSNRWKIGLASVAGAAVIGVTGGLAAAPLVAAGLSSVMGGLGLGASAAAGYLGAVAGSSVIVGTLFGAYGGRMSGQMMERYAKEVEDFSFHPVHTSPPPRLRVGIGISGWIVADGPRDAINPWRSLGGGLESYALVYELTALRALGNALTNLLYSKVTAWVKKEIIKRTVFSTLYSALWPLGLVKYARIVDNPFSLAKTRSEKAGRVLADAIINKTQGERPVTLVGFSLGARVIYTCLLELADRGAFGLVENVVLIGAAVPAGADSWAAVRMVVAGRVVNVYSAQDWVLAFLYRTNSIQLGVAGLQEIKGVTGVENVDAGKTVDGHLKYRFAVAKILEGVLELDVDETEARREEEVLERVEKDERREEVQVQVQVDIEPDAAVEKGKIQAA